MLSPNPVEEWGLTVAGMLGLEPRNAGVKELCLKFKDTPETAHSSTYIGGMGCFGCFLNYYIVLYFIIFYCFVLYFCLKIAIGKRFGKRTGKGIF
jgi:hypothetical protein